MPDLTKEIKPLYDELRAKRIAQLESIIESVDVMARHDHSEAARLREDYQTLIDFRHALRLERGDDLTLSLAELKIATDDLNAWDMTGVVPMSVWEVMREWEREAVRRNAADDGRRLWLIAASMCCVVVAVLACIDGAVLGTALFSMSAVLLCIVSMLIPRDSDVYARMVPPGTASALKHTARTYEVANGMLTLASAAQGGELTVATAGDLEVYND